MAKRARVSISLSPKNPNAVAVLEAIRNIPERQRSATLLRWAAAYLNGEQRATKIAVDTGFSDEEIDDLLDAF